MEGIIDWALGCALGLVPGEEHFVFEEHRGEQGGHEHVHRKFLDRLGTGRHRNHRSLTATHRFEFTSHIVHHLKLIFHSLVQTHMFLHAKDSKIGNKNIEKYYTGAIRSHNLDGEWPYRPSSRAFSSFFARVALSMSLAQQNPGISCHVEFWAEVTIFSMS